jgi:hypothetical protein
MCILPVLGGSLNFGNTIFGSGSEKKFRTKEFIDFSFSKKLQQRIDDFHERTSK